MEVGAAHLALRIPMGAVLRTPMLHPLWLLQAGTDKEGGNYCHSASHLAEELKLHNGPAVLTVG